MGLFKPAQCEAAFLKMGMLGFAGSGKTHTACLTAIGLYKAAEKKKMPYAGKPVYFIDTENGSDYIVELFEKESVPLVVAKTRAFSDLKEAVIEAENDGSVLIIDSISHFWMEFQESYKKKKKRTRGLTIQDWGHLKTEWRSSFTDRYLNSNLHVIMCGRASFDYDHFEDEDGKKQIEKSGVKMSAEKELGFEPSLLVCMERSVNPDTKKVFRKAVVMKDRFRKLDGKELANPTFKSFVPHIEKLKWGADQASVDTSRTSQAMIEPDQYDRRKVDRDIVLDQIQDLLTLHFGSSQEEKKNRIKILESAFGTSAKTAIEKRLSLEDLQIGYDRIHLELTGEAGPYDTMKFADTDLNDEIPHMEFKSDAQTQEPNQGREDSGSNCATGTSGSGEGEGDDGRSNHQPDRGRPLAKAGGSRRGQSSDQSALSLNS